MSVVIKHNSVKPKNDKEYKGLYKLYRILTSRKIPTTVSFVCVSFLYMKSSNNYQNPTFSTLLGCAVTSCLYMCATDFILGLCPRIMNPIATAYFIWYATRVSSTV